MALHPVYKAEDIRTPSLVQQLKANDREAAHQAVKAFDHNPTVANTDAAISALVAYRTWLS